MLERIKKYLQATRREDQESFVSAHPHPVFVVLPFSQKIEDTGVVTLIGRGLQPTLTSVGEICKRAGANRLASMITIGRTRHNDIEIKASDISKMHAYVLKQGQELKLIDSGSTNGTFVGGHRLEPRKERASLSSGDQVTFANVKTIYFTPEAFYDYLQQLEQGAA